MNEDDFDGQGETSDPEGVRILGADEAAEAMERDDVVRRRSADEPRPGDRPVPPHSDGPEPVLRFPASGGEGSGDLPHWTEPPTGQVPATGGTIFDEPGDTASDWPSFTATPRWRDQDSDWTEEVRALADEGPRGGALDDDRPDPEEFFRFDDLDAEPDAPSVFGDVPPPDPLAPPIDPLAESGYDSPAMDDPYGESPVGDDLGPRKIVVGGGRITPGDPNRPVVGDRSIGGDRDIGQAAIVGVVFIGIAAALFALGPAAAALLVVVVVTAAAAEFMTRIREVGFQPAVLVGLVGTAGMVLGAYHRGEAAIPVVLTLTAAFSMLWYLIGAGEGRATVNIGATVLTVAWVGMFGSFATALLAVQGGPGVGDAGKGILFGAILATVGYDVGGYFVGRSRGRSPLSQASPNKTIEGLVGGCILALAVGAGYGIVSEPLASVGDGLWLGVAVAVAAPLGDLSQSMIKRDLGIKDMGTLLPGHGGLLDRFDALLFVLPAVYYVAKLQDFFL